MDRELLVYVDLQGALHLVGRLWARTRKDRENATFEYDKSWLGHAERFSLEPALRLGPGPFHTGSGKPLFGAIVKPRVLTTAIDLEDGTASLKLAYDVASYFELTAEDARAISREAGNAVASWRKEAARLGVGNAEIDRMASAFEHDDLAAAVTGKGMYGAGGGT